MNVFLVEAEKIISLDEKKIKSLSKHKKQKKIEMPDFIPTTLAEYNKCNTLIVCHVLFTKKTIQNVTNKMATLLRQENVDSNKLSNAKNYTMFFDKNKIRGSLLSVCNNTCTYVEINFPLEKEVHLYRQHDLEKMKEEFFVLYENSFLNSIVLSESINIEKSSRKIKI